MCAFETPWFLKTKTSDVGQMNQLVEERLHRSVTELEFKERRTMRKIDEEMERVRDCLHHIRADIDFSTDLDENGRQIDSEECRSKSTGDVPGQTKTAAADRLVNMKGSKSALVTSQTTRNGRYETRITRLPEMHESWLTSQKPLETVINYAKLTAETVEKKRRKNKHRENGEQNESEPKLTDAGCDRATRVREYDNGVGGKKRGLDTNSMKYRGNAESERGLDANHMKYRGNADSDFIHVVQRADNALTLPNIKINGKLKKVKRKQGRDK